MMVPFLDLKAQIAPLRAELDAAIADVVDNTAFILGDRLAGFERDFASFCGCREAVGVDSGTQALHLILRSMGVGEGDEVVTVPNTFIATVEAIVYTGATPVFVDVDPDTWLMDPSALAGAITPRTKAILPVHLFGNVLPWDELVAVAGDIPLVEDACQAHGARFDGRRTGSLGLAGAFSFYPGKNLGGFGDGGMVVTDDADMVALLRSLRHHGQGDKNLHDHIGYTGRLDALQAVVLDIKLKHLDTWNAKRREVAGHYRERLEGTYRMPAVVPGTEPVHHLFPIQDRDAAGLITRLKEHNVFCGRHYPVACHLQPALSGLIAEGTSYPVAEDLCENIVSLPIFAEMTHEMVDFVCDLLL
ncbi:DegT/DnrJ/EryC1/StrS family aminotransferase [bacterium]|nr:DegT/DnrJ/EryC1/StrS family aminotransferase [bacterium]MBU1072788.1 DegT/DnrJ/EryC1/StrS family aminotransferase [bacterium]MBU1674776.1 DegT/DnrJ/EryC1/StrS family aminotransferase [bacterium]